MYKICMNEFNLDIPDLSTFRREAERSEPKDHQDSNPESAESPVNEEERQRLIQEGIERDAASIVTAREKAEEAAEEAATLDADDMPDGKATKLRDIGKGTAKLGLGGGKLLGAGLLFAVLGAFRLTRWGVIRAMTLTDRLMQKVDSIADGLTKFIKNPFLGVKKINDAFGWVRSKLLPEKSLGEYVKKKDEQKKREEKK